MTNAWAFEQQAQAGDSLVYDEAGHDLRLMLKLRYVRQSFMPLCPRLERDALPQDAGGGLLLFGRQIIV